MRTDSFQVGKKNKGGRHRLSSSHHSLFSGRDSDEEEHRDNYKILHKVHYHSNWKRNQDADHWVKLSRAQDQGLQFWQTKSHAIIVHSPVPADCIKRVISQNGDRIIFERHNPTTHAESHTEKQLALAAAAVSLGCMCRLVQGDLCGILSQLLKPSNTLKSIFE